MAADSFASFLEATRSSLPYHAPSVTLKLLRSRPPGLPSNPSTVLEACRAATKEEEAHETAL